MHAPPSPPALAVPRGAVPVSWPLCDTVQHPSSSFINLFMGNQKSISLPPDWRDELLEGTTDEIQKGWGRLVPRQKHRAALPWIKLLMKGRREDMNEEQCDKSSSSSSPRTAGRCAEAATRAGWKHQLPFHAGSLARGQTSLQQELWAEACVQATVSLRLSHSQPLPHPFPHPQDQAAPCCCSL